MHTQFNSRFRIILYGALALGLFVLFGAVSLPAAQAQGSSDPTPPGVLVVPLAFGKQLPAKNATFPPGSPVTLAWDTSTHATNYFFCYDKTNDNHCDGTWYWNDNTDITINVTGRDLDAGATYYWQAMACTSGDPRPSGCIEADYGEWWSFKISPAVFYSIGSQDGWIRENSENSGTGGALDANNNLRIGDATLDRQYLSILSFDTSSLPDRAYVTSAVLQIRKSGVVGSNPFLTLGSLRTAIREPYFGSSSSLALNDFNAAVSAANIGTFSLISTSLYSATLNSAGCAYINKAGLTQFRLYFSKDDNDNGAADYMEFYSGNYATKTYQPQLVIKYMP